MNRNLGLLIVLAVLFAAGCGGRGGVPPAGASLDANARVTVGDPAFVLSDEGSLYASAGSPFSVETAFNPETGELQASVWARGVADLKTALFCLSYPMEAYHLVLVEYAGGLGPDGDVVVAIIPLRPRIWMGAAIIHFPERAGVNGDCELFRLVFAPGPEPPVRVAALAPSDPQAAAILAGSLQADNSVLLAWTEQNPGDGNNDGRVNIQDVTPIARNFLHRIGDGQNEAEDALADYNRDGTVNIMDVTKIARNFLVELHGYDVETAPAAAGPFQRIPNPDSPGDPNVPTLVRSEEFPVAPKPLDGPLAWSYLSAPIEGKVYFRVRPKDAEGQAGMESNTAVFEGITEILSMELRLPEGEEQWLVITEEAVDDIPGNEQPWASSELQLEAWAEVEGREEEVNVTNLVVWELESGYNSASIGNTADLNKGLLTATDVGVARVVAHPTNDLTTAASLEIPIYAISDITLRVAGQVEPQDITVPRGTDVHFEAIGIFDDNDGDAEDLLELNISTCASWAVGRPIVSAGPPVVYEDGAFALEFFYGAAPALDRGILHTNDPNLQAGFRGFVSVCFPPDSFPPGEVEPTIGGGFRAFSNMITVTLE